MRSGILRTYVATLRLRRDAPWPSEIRARQQYRMRFRSKLRANCSTSDSKSLNTKVRT